ncbi:hypothetical protein ACFL56_02640 [Candidatus Margulisiibacteriota bacterium]
MQGINKGIPEFRKEPYGVPIYKTHREEISPTEEEPLEEETITSQLSEEDVLFIEENREDIEQLLNEHPEINLDPSVHISFGYEISSSTSPDVTGQYMSTLRSPTPLYNLHNSYISGLTTADSDTLAQETMQQWADSGESGHELNVCPKSNGQYAVGLIFRYDPSSNSSLVSPGQVDNFLQQHGVVQTDSSGNTYYTFSPSFFLHPPDTLTKDELIIFNAFMRIYIMDVRASEDYAEMWEEHFNELDTSTDPVPFDYDHVDSLMDIYHLINRIPSIVDDQGVDHGEDVLQCILEVLLAPEDIDRASILQGYQHLSEEAKLYICTYFAQFYATNYNKEDKDTQGYSTVMEHFENLRRILVDAEDIAIGVCRHSAFLTTWIGHELGLDICTIGGIQHTLGPHALSMVRSETGEILLIDYGMIYHTDTEDPRQAITQYHRESEQLDTVVFTYNAEGRPVSYIVTPAAEDVLAMGSIEDTSLTLADFFHRTGREMVDEGVFVHITNIEQRATVSGRYFSIEFGHLDRSGDFTNTIHEVSHLRLGFHVGNDIRYFSISVTDIFGTGLNLLNETFDINTLAAVIQIGLKHEIELSDTLSLTLASVIQSHLIANLQRPEYEGAESDILRDGIPLDVAYGIDLTYQPQETTTLYVSLFQDVVPYTTIQAGRSDWLQQLTFLSETQLGIRLGLEHCFEQVGELDLELTYEGHFTRYLSAYLILSAHFNDLFDTGFGIGVETEFYSSNYSFDTDSATFSVDATYETNSGVSVSLDYEREAVEYGDINHALEFELRVPFDSIIHENGPLGRLQRRIRNRRGERQEQ